MVGVSGESDAAMKNEWRSFQDLDRAVKILRVFGLKELRVEHAALVLNRHAVRGAMAMTAVNGFGDHREQVAQSAAMLHEGAVKPW